MEETGNKPVSVINAVKKGTRYFFANILFIFLFMVPYLLLGAAFYKTNILANPYRLFDMPYLLYVLPLLFC